MRDVHPARNGGDAQHQEGQRDHAADPDQRLDERLRYLHGAGRARAVRHDHEGPAALRLLAHLFATTSPENASTRHNRVPVLHGPAEWRTRTGRGVRSPSGRLKYGLPGKPSTRANVIRITSPWASGGSQPRLGEQDGRLLDLPACQIEGVQLPQPNALQWGGEGSWTPSIWQGGRSRSRPSCSPSLG